MNSENIGNHREENHEDADWNSLQNIEPATPKDVILEKIKNNLNIKKVFATVGLAASLTAGTIGASKGVEALQEKSAVSAYAEAFPDMEGNETWKETIRDEAKTKEGREFLKNAAEQKKQDDKLVAEYMAVYGEKSEDWAWAMIRSGHRDSLIEDIERRKASKQNEVAQPQEQPSRPIPNPIVQNEVAQPQEQPSRPIPTIPNPIVPEGAWHMSPHTETPYSLREDQQTPPSGVPESELYTPSHDEKEDHYINSQP